MGAGERNGGRKGKVSGFACRLPCIVGRAISHAGEPGGRRKAAAVGSFRGGRERPPYTPPQMGAGERNVGRKGKVPGFACRLPCIVGRAISPAGEPGGRRKAAGKIDAHPKHCGDRQLCGTMPSIGPETLRSREALQNKAGIGSGRPRQPEVTAAKDRTSISLFHPITGNTRRVARMMPNVTAQNTAQSTSVRPNFSTFSRVRPAPPR